jgi:hypothetical protein
LWRIGKIKENRFGLLEVINWGKVNMWRKLMIDEGYFNKVFFCGKNFSINFLSPVTRFVFLPLQERRG